MAVVLAAAALIAATAWAASRTHDVKAGETHVLVAGRHLSKGGELRVLYFGTLSVVGRCLGVQGQADNVVLWPPGTKVHGAGDSLALTVEGRTFHLGDRISYSRYESLRSGIPDACRGHGAIRIHDVDPLDFDPSHG